MAVISSDMLHATTVAIDGKAVVIQGGSGTGKSDLALRLLDRGARLVADDQTRVVREGTSLVASAPDAIAGRIEVHGIGILSRPAAGPTPVALVVRLTEKAPRFPEKEMRRIAGIAIREIAIDPWQISAAIKVELALREAEITWA